MNSTAQIWQTCWNCGDTISLIATRGLRNKNDVIDSISDDIFYEIIGSKEWRVKDYNAKVNTCPKCASRASDEWYFRMKLHMDLTKQNTKVRW